MFNKKGETPLWITVTLVVAVVGIIIISVVLLNLDGGDAQSKSDAICKFTNLATGQGGVVGNLAPKSISVEGICPTQLVKIDPADWNECDRRLELEYKAGRKISALKKCASQQVANLIYRCWKMGGSGALDPGTWACFNVHLASSSDETIEDYKAFRTELSKELDQLMDCSKVDREIRSECKADREEVISLLINKMTYASLIKFYRDIAVSNIDLCFVNSPEELPDEEVLECEVSGDTITDCDFDGVDGNLDYCPATPAEYKFEVGPQGCSAGELYDQIPSESAEAINFTLNGKVDFNKLNCLGLISVVAKAKTNENVYGSSITLVDSQISNLLAKYPDLDIQLDVDNKILELGSGVPRIDKITSDYLINLMRTTINPATGDNYCADFPCNKKRFDMDIKIESNSLFEIALCDPPAPIGSGFFAPCRGGKQRILISPTSQGVAQNKNPYSDMCNLFNSNIGIPVVDLNLPAHCAKITNTLFGQ